MSTPAKQGAAEPKILIVDDPGPVYALTAADADVQLLIGGEGSKQDRRDAMAACMARERHARQKWIEDYKKQGKQLAAMTKRAENLDAVYRAYIDYLREAEEMTVGFLHVHNWRWNEQFVERGVKLRAEIEKARSAPSLRGDGNEG